MKIMLWLVADCVRIKAIDAGGCGTKEKEYLDEMEDEP